MPSASLEPLQSLCALQLQELLLTLEEALANHRNGPTGGTRWVPIVHNESKVANKAVSGRPT